MSHAGFWVEGPYVLPRVEDEHRFAVRVQRSFWQSVDAQARYDVSAGVGCYVFGLRTPRAVVPWYVGKTVASFRSEVFAADKERKYWRVISQFKRATPVWFFLVQQRERGRPNGKQIEALEKELIRRVQMRNTELLNVRDRHREEWWIHQYDCACRGRKTRGAIAFSRMLHGDDS